MGELLHRFFEDTQIQIFALLIVLDLALGVLVALKTKTFRLSYLADFARNDIAFKVIPAFLLYGGYVFAKNAEIVIPGFDMEIISRAAVGIAMAAMVGSLLKSIRDMGLFGEVVGEAPTPQPLDDALAGPDPNSTAQP